MPTKGDQQGGQMREVCRILLFMLLAVLLMDCAAPPLGPPVGLVPPFDQLFGVLFVMAIFIAGVYGWKRFKAKSRHLAESVRPSPSAEEILRRRYVSGELSREEFLRMLDDIKAGDHEKQ